MVASRVGQQNIGQLFGAGQCGQVARVHRDYVNIGNPVRHAHLGVASAPTCCYSVHHVSNRAWEEGRRPTTAWRLRPWWAGGQRTPGTAQPPLYPCRCIGFGKQPTEAPETPAETVCSGLPGSLNPSLLGPGQRADHGLLTDGNDPGNQDQPLRRLGQLVSRP